MFDATADEYSGGFKRGWRDAQWAREPLFVQDGRGIVPTLDDPAANHWSDEGRRQYVAGYNAFVVVDC